MATSRTKFVTADENANSRLTAQLKSKATLSEQSNTMTTANEPQRRVVLGGLENNPLQAKNNVSKTLKQSLKEIKPKVDTHWKRNGSSQAIAVPTVKKTSTSTTSSSIVAPGMMGRIDQQRVLAEAVKSTSVTTTTSQLMAEAVKKVTSKATAVTRPTTNLFKKSSSSSVAMSLAAADTIMSHSSRKLVQHVDDIDALDEDNPFLMSEYVVHIYNYLQKLERQYPIREGFLDNHEEINPRMRSVLIDWINEVHFQFKLLPETYFMAIGLIDRYLQEQVGVARKNLQLVGAAALFVAAKYEELFPPVLADFVYITDNTYSERQVIEMEKHMLSTLKFELCRPVAIQFLRRYSKAAVSETSTHTLAKYFIELSTIDYQMSHHAPSLTAAASLYLALILLKTKTSLAEMRFVEFWRKSSATRSPPASVQLWTANLAYYSNYKETELRPIVKKLATLVLSAPKLKSCRAIYNKYSLTKFEKCAQLPELSGSLAKTLSQDTGDNSPTASVVVEGQ